MINEFSSIKSENVRKLSENNTLTTENFMKNKSNSHNSEKKTKFQRQ